MVYPGSSVFPYRFAGAQILADNTEISNAVFLLLGFTGGAVFFPGFDRGCDALF
jgi:hypothetical protein